MNPSHAPLVVVFLCLLFTACGEQSPEDKSSVDSASLEVSSSDATVSDVEATDTVAVDTSADGAADDCPGGANCPCDTNADCDAGLCLESAQGKRCGKPCVDSCDPGYVCAQVPQGSDIISVCVNAWARLCSPCSKSEQCNHPGVTDARCVDRGVDGAFCGAACKEQSDCPAGYACKDTKDVSDNPTSQCMPVSDGGELTSCLCSPNALALALKTTCSQTVTVNGAEVTCSGVSQCKESGAAPECQANEPQPETCDGVDNDCDGETDESTCDDNNPCTTDSCTPAQGCQHPLVKDETDCAADGSKYCLVGECIDKLKCPADCKSPGGVIATKQEAKLVAPDGAQYDAAGRAVAIDGDLAVVGADGADDKGNSSGNVTIYARQTDGSWAKTTKLVGNDTTQGDRFGCSVALKGDRLVVGACADDDKGASTGAVYIFKQQGKGSWTQVTKLVPADGEIGGYFGTHVALSGDRLVVSAQGASPKGKSSGAAYVYEPQTITKWKQVAKLVAADGKAYDNFGKALALSGDHVAVGAPGVDGKGQNSGAAYVFERQTDGSWSEVSKLVPADNDAEDAFGGSVAIDGDRLLCGAQSAKTKAPYAGAVYIYERQKSGKWAEVSTLVPSTSGKSSLCGSAVDLSGERALVGCESAATVGAVVVYRRQSDGVWAEAAKLTAGDGAKSDYFGDSLAMSADRVVVGAFADDDKGTSSGSAYVFDLGEYTCSGPGACICKAGYTGPDCSVKSP